LGVHAIANAVQDQEMHLLDARSSVVRNANMDVGFTQSRAHPATAFAREGHHDHLARVRRLDGGQHVG
jgi:hypothetical protein